MLCCVWSSTILKGYKEAMEVSKPKLLRMLQGASNKLMIIFKGTHI